VRQASRGVNVGRERGARVTIEKVEITDDEVRLDIKMNKVRARSDSSSTTSSAGARRRREDVSRSVRGERAELQARSAAWTSQPGCRTDDVIARKGHQDAGDLGARTIMTYDDMKLVFQDNTLVDVQ